WEEGTSMATVTKSVDVFVPVTTAYNQWTQFEEFPKFMEGVEQVQQLDDSHLKWVAEIGGQTRRWQAEITDQIPDQKIAWTSIEGAQNAGTVTFEPLAENRTRVNLTMDFEPEGVTEKIGDATGIVENQVENDLERFKSLIETLGVETGAWRGEI
ncbi:MAG: SRPBCC family protein, partial [Actinomycetota bacterium]